MEHLIENYVLNGFWFIMGAFISSIILIPFEETLLHFLRDRWLLFRGKAVKGTVVKCSIYSDNITNNNLLFNSKFIFEVKLPFPNIGTDYMDLIESNQIIFQAILNKYGIDLQKNDCMLNNVHPKYNVIIRKTDLDFPVY